MRRAGRSEGRRRPLHTVVRRVKAVAGGLLCSGPARVVFGARTKGCSVTRDEQQPILADTTSQDWTSSSPSQLQRHPHGILPLSPILEQRS
ncbi:unnamed protein product, partial [Amoebophrya sp. A25]|eukprot:GSA25T00010601001.1